MAIYEKPILVRFNFNNGGEIGSICFVCHDNGSDDSIADGLVEYHSYKAVTTGDAPTLKAGSTLTVDDSGNWEVRITGQSAGIIATLNGQFSVIPSDWTGFAGITSIEILLEDTQVIDAGRFFGLYVDSDSAFYASFGTPYGPAGTRNGTLSADVILVSAGGTYLEPNGDAYAQLGPDYGAGGNQGGKSLLYNKILAGTLVNSIDLGTVVLPAAGIVKAGETFGDNGDQSTGTYDPITGNYSNPGISHVQSGTTYTFAGSLLSGTYDPVSGSFTNPGISNVRSGVSYTFAGSPLTGTFVYGTGTDLTGLIFHAGTTDVVNHARIIEDSPVTVLGRIIDGQGALLTQSSTTTITVKVFDRASAEQITPTLTPVISDVIYNSLQTGGMWTRDSIGYNFAVTLASTYFAAGNATYRVEVKFTPAAGAPFYVLWDLEATDILSE